MVALGNLPAVSAQMLAKLGSNWTVALVRKPLTLATTIIMIKNATETVLLLLLRTS